MKKVLRLTSILLLVLISISLNNCRMEKDELVEPEQKKKTTFNDIDVPPGFEFEMEEEKTFKVTLVYPDFPDDVSLTVEIHNRNPIQDANLLAIGTLGYGKMFECKLNLSTALKSVFILVKYGEKVFEMAEIELLGNSFNYAVGKNLRSNRNTTYVSSPDCNSGCTISYPGITNDDIDLENGDVVCIPEGAEFSGDITFKNGTATLKVCGEVDIDDLDQWNGTAIIEVGVNAIFDVNDYNIWTSTSQFINYSDSLDWHNKSIDINHRFENHGDVYLKKFELWGTAELINTGNLHLSDKLEVWGDAVVTNDGYLYVKKKVEMGDDGHIINNCHMDADDHFKVWSKFTNNGYLWVDKEFEVSFGWNDEVILMEGSLIEADDMELSDELTGPTGAYARIDIADNTKIWWGGGLTNNIDLCDADGIEDLYGTIGPNVTFCQAYIPPNGSCNPGAGTPTDPDTDGDGVTDTNDAYPNDPDRAYNTYYPSSSDFSTLTFEDLWPAKGDYDFNDLVLEYQYTTVTNAGNDVVDLVGKYKIKATGAGFDNGFGVMFPFGSGIVNTVTGYEVKDNLINYNANGTESGQTGDAVVIVYDNINLYVGSAMVNVVNTGGAYANVDTTTVTINFTSPQSSIGTPPYNPFIFVDRTRGREVHLLDEPPTSLANSNYFGTDDDASNPNSGVYYQTSNGLPWGLNIPTEFDWMIEGDDIITGYLKFVNWAQSGGTQYPDWYSNISSGYRNSAKIYSGQYSN